MFRNIIINNQRPLSLINIRKHNALFSGRNHCNYSTTSGVSSPERQCYLEPLKSTDLTGITVLNLNRPASKNALGRQMLGELEECVNHLRFDNECRVVLVRSLVDGVFCAGADLKERGHMNQQQVSQFVFQLRSVFSQLEQIPVPTIAAIDGAALGGGLELALCCDFRVAGSKAVLGLPETKLAIIPGAGGTQRLPRLIGVSRAKELIFTGRRLTAQVAFDYGVVNEVATGGQSAFEQALQLAREIQPQGPIALRMAKLAIQQGAQLEMQSGLLMEQMAYAQVIPTKDRLEGLAAFKEKRKPHYRDGSNCPVEPLLLQPHPPESPNNLTIQRRLLDQSQMSHFLQSPAVRHLMSFILQVNESVKNQTISATQTAHPTLPLPLQCLHRLLDRLWDWIDECPPLVDEQSQRMQRFGNLAFRQWQSKLLDGDLPAMLEQTLFNDSRVDYSRWPFIRQELAAYFGQAFGNRTRLDYGTGHELNFAAFLCCLDRLGFFHSHDGTVVAAAVKGANYRLLGLSVFPRYLKVVRRLQKVYRLEPAGSHGVWGLDDFQHLPYLWGAAQLIDHPRMKPKSLLNKEIIEHYSKDYLFFGAVAFIHEMKRGPFHEHSPMLYDISAVPNWNKVNIGLIKMYYGEVLEKFPVVQHFEFGQILPW